MNKNILRIAIPNIISNITVPLLGMIDIAIVGHMDSPLYIGAMTISTTIFNFIYWNFSFLRMGTSGFTAQAYGAKNDKECANVLVRSLAIAFVGALLALMFQFLILKLAFNFVEVTPESEEYVKTYFYIYIWAAPAVLAMYAFMGWFIGMQDSKTPMYISICVNVINIILSFTFVYGLKMRIEGVALASTLAQTSGLLLAIGFWWTKYKKFRNLINLSVLKDITSYKPFFKVNGDIYIRTICMILVMTFFTATSSKMGNTLLSVNAMIMQMFMLFSFIMDGFAYAGEALTGRYIGAHEPSNLNRMIKRLFVWGGLLSLFFVLLYALFSEQIMRILTDEKDIIAAFAPYKMWTLLIPIASFSAFLWDGVFVGATASKHMRNSMLVAVVCFFILYYSLRGTLENNALWLAFIVYLAMRGIMQMILYRNIKPTLISDKSE